MFNIPQDQDLTKFNRVLIYSKAEPTKYITVDGFVNSAYVEDGILYIKTNIQYSCFNCQDIYAVIFGNY